MIDQRQAGQLATLLYTAFADYEAGDDIADQILAIAQAIETNEATPGGINLLDFVQSYGMAPIVDRPRLTLIQ